jgi:hypothetical protein
MLVVSLAKAVFRPASAGLGLACSQVVSKANSLVAAIASTKPSGLTVFDASKGDYSKSFKALSGEINSNSAHRFIMN